MEPSTSQNQVTITADAIGTIVINPPAQGATKDGESPRTDEQELITDDVPRPITIARMMDQRLIVDDDALYDFLARDDVKGRPLVIVSIAGAYRTGKSFLMNFFFRYLRNKGWENKNWFGGDDTRITPQGPEFVFPFKRSTEGCTKDIRVCPEVFRMPIRDGQMAAVILVDTQGLYDAGLTADSNARIMSISMLFSSLQVFNIQRQMESRHLESLQLWTNLSAASASFKLTSGKDKAFQDLKIVIRDFEHGGYDFGKNNTYLAKVLEEFSRIGEMDEVNRSVKSAFSDLGCFLMPHPGKGVTRCSSQRIENKDMDEDFQKTVKELVEDVFDPENLSVKRKMDGRKADSTDLLHLLGRVGKAYENGEAPTARTALQATKQADNTKALNLAVSKYQKKMSKICSGKFLTDDEIKNANEKAMKKAEKQFHDNATMGSDKDKEKFFIQFQQECGDMLNSTFCMRNKEEKEKILTHIEYMVIHCTNRYRQAMQQKVESVTLESFQLLHETLKNENMTKFDAEMEKHEQLEPDILKMRADLESGIECTFVRFEAQLKIKSVEKSKIRIIKKFSKQVNELPLQLEERNEKEVLFTLLNSCILEYKEMTRDKNDDDDSLTDLEEILKNLKEETIELNARKRDHLKRICQDLGNFFGDFFEDSLKEELVHGFITEDCFKRYVDEFISHHLDSLLTGNDKLPEWGKEIVRQKFDEKVADIRKRNNNNKFFRSIRFKVLKMSEKMSPAIHEVLKSLLRSL